MQGLADGYFCIIYNGDYLAPDIKTGKISTDLPEFERRKCKRVLNVLSQ
jgi:succinate dehydrogenase / fumarate reductase flavoprotein subunit